MSVFGVTIEKIESIIPHPNADRLELVKLWGMDYQMVVGKDVHQVGDEVVYFPLDSVMSDDVLEIIGLSSKLSGKNKNVVKTIKLRGAVSQGLVCGLQELNAYWSDYDVPGVGTDLTELLGVTKHETQAVISKGANLHHLPNYVHKYDIENAERYSDIIDILLNVPVSITEKVEGSHWACSLDCKSDEVHVYQRNYEIVPIENAEHTWWKVFREGEFERKLNELKEWMKKKSGHITVRGEIIGPGIQNNHYKLKAHKVLVFEIEIDGEPIDFYNDGCVLNFIDFTGTNWAEQRFEIVPTLCSPKGCSLNRWIEAETIGNGEINDYQDLKVVKSLLPQASNGKSLINPDVMREGVVIKPIREMQYDGFGRVFIKQKSPEYLSKGK